MKPFLLRAASIVAFAAVAALIHGATIENGFRMPRQAEDRLPGALADRLAERRAPQPAPAGEAAATEAPAPEDSVIAVPAVPDDEDEYLGLRSADLHELWLMDAVVLIDSRPRSQFVQGHIPGAFSVPFEDFNRRWPEISPFFPADPFFVVYCDGGGCHASENVASLILEQGIEDVVIYRRGFDAWVARGYEVEDGEPLI